jgi:hypothetical protein
MPLLAACLLRAELLIGLFALREQRLVDIKCRLVAPQQDQQKAEQQQQQSQNQNESGKADAADAGQPAAEASAAGSRQRRGRSASLGPEAAPGGGKRGGGKAAGKAGSGAAPGDAAVAAAGVRGSSNRAVAAEAKELPTAILVEVWMTQQARDRSQWYDEHSGNVPERMQGRKPRWQVSRATIKQRTPRCRLQRCLLWRLQAERCPVHVVLVQMC